MLIPAAWAYLTTLERRSPWLWRLLALEAVYIAFFIQWYLSRYYADIHRMNFWPMVRLLGGYRLRYHIRRAVIRLGERRGPQKTRPVAHVIILSPPSPPNEIGSGI
jgi:hypothetical protein